MGIVVQELKIVRLQHCPLSSKSLFQFITISMALTILLTDATAFVGCIWDTELTSSEHKRPAAGKWRKNRSCLIGLW